MSLLKRIIHQLDSQSEDIPFYQNELEDVKSNIEALLNTKLDDCIVAGDLGLSSTLESNSDIIDLYFKMAKRISFLISKYEKRIKILSMCYDNSSTHYQLSFLLRCNFFEDHFKEFDLKIVFKNDRYCEVI